MSSMLDLGPFEGTLQALVDQNSSQPVQVHLVDTIEPGDVLGQARRERNGPGLAILLRRHISSDRQRSVLDALTMFGGQPEAESTIYTPLRFAMHLTLHELAHLELDVGNEREADCDAWAIAKMQHFCGNDDAEIAETIRAETKMPARGGHLRR